MTPQLLLLSGPPASGKDAVTQALADLDDRFTLFRRLKAGSGRSAGYRTVSRVQLDELRQRGEIIQCHERYGNLYAVDAPSLHLMLASRQCPVIHVGRLANLAPLQAAAPSLSVLLWADEVTVGRRLRTRGDSDVIERTAAWREERDEVLAAPPMTWHVVISTVGSSPAQVAREVRAAFDGPPSPVHDVSAVLGADALALSRGLSIEP